MREASALPIDQSQETASVAPELPADRQRSRTGVDNRVVHEVVLSGEPPADTAVLAAGVAALAARVTGRRDFSLATPSPGGGSRPLHFRIAGDPAFAALVEQARDALAGADAPAAGESRIAAGDLLFAVRPVAGPGGAVVLSAEYDADRFETAGPGHLETLRAVLETALVDPARTVGSLPLAAPRTLETLLGDWAVVPGGHPEGAGIVDMFAEQVVEGPDTVAVVDPGADPASGGHSLTYGELDRRAERLARRLAALGVVRGTPVAVALPRSIDFLVAILAVLRAGGAYVPIDAGYPEDRLAFMLEDTAAPLVLTRSALAERLPIPAGARVVVLDGPAAAARPVGEAGGGPFPATGAGDLAYVTYTSGSTGRPKGVAVVQRGVVRLVKGVDYDRLGPDQTFLFLAAVTFDATTLEVWAPLLNGGRLVLFTDERPTPDRLADVLARERITFLWFTAGLFHQVVEARPDAFAPVPHVLSGGDVLSADACRRVLEMHPGTIFTDGYGPTENTTFSTCHRMTRPEEVPDPVPIGRPVTGSEAFVLGTELEALPAWVPGELMVGGDGLAFGYWRRPGLTAEKFVPHPHAGRPGERLYRTGDLARWRADGTLEFLGRHDTQVKLRGFRIELGEIESALASHPGVGEHVVIARGEPGSADRVLVAYYVPVPVESGAGGGGVPTPRDLLDHLARTLPEHMLPAAFVALGCLPLSPSGKVDRAALPAPGPEHRATAAEHVAPQSETEAILAGIWSQVLGVPRVGLTDDFFHLGGHSLRAAGIFARVASAFGTDMPIGSLFGARTLGAFAAEVERARAAAADGSALGPLPPVARRGPEHRERAPLSVAQRGLWLIDRLHAENIRYNLPTRFRLRGEGLSPARVADALGAVVRRHESLRATFGPGEDGVGEQRFLPPVPGPLALPVVDLSGLPAGRRGEAAVAGLDAEGRRPFGLDRVDGGGVPPVRALLLRSAPDDHHLLFHPHHIVFDGWSVELLSAELRALYADPRTALPELPVEYGDYALWQQEVQTEERLAPEIAHWREHLAGLPPVLDLPSDRPRPREAGERGGEARVTVGHDVAAAVDELARSEGATLFMAVLAALATVLGRWTGRDEVPIGSAVAGRQRPEVEGLLGYFVNTVVMRCDLSGGPSFRQLLGRCREETARALSHSLPFDRLVAELKAEPDASHHPVIQVMISGQDLDRIDGELAPGLSLTVETGGNRTARLDLALFTERRAGGLGLRFEYAADLFDRETIERLGRQVAHVLRRAVAAPDAPLDALDVVPEDERRVLLDEWRLATSDYPRDAGLVELFERQVTERPDAVAVACMSARGAEQVTYRELDRRARALARRIVAALGSGFVRGTTVGLALDRSVDQVVTILAAVRAGGAYVPLDANYPEERLVFLAADAGVRVLVSEGKVLDRLPFLSERDDLAVLRLDGLDLSGEVAEEGGPGPEEIPTGAEDAAYVCYTSGSTGKPKGAVVPHRGVARLVLGADYARYAPDETFLLLAPVSFDLTTLELWGPLLTGGRLALYPAERPTPEGLADVLARERVTTLWLTAGLFHHVVEDAPEALAPLRLLMAGGDVLNPELCRNVLRAHPGMVLVNGYGPTENTTFTACHRMTRPEEVGTPVPIGLPIADTSAVVVDARFRLQPVGVPGELVTGGDGVAWCYWNRPALTAERFVPDPWGSRSGEPGARLYRTGDLARWIRRREGGGILEFLGRNDGQVKVRGFRIELGEIEAALTAHPQVHRAVVVARRAVAAAERVLVGYVVPDGDEEPAEAELRTWLESRLPPYMVPGALLVLRELPLDPNGKVARKLLPDPAEVASGPGERIAPRTDTERAVAAIWSEVLGVPEPAVGDDFFRLGGHSLLAARVVSRLRARLGVDTSLSRLFALRTLEALAAEVESLRAPEGPAPAQSIRRATRRTLIRPSRGGGEP